MGGSNVTAGVPSGPRNAIQRPPSVVISSLPPAGLATTIAVPPFQVASGRRVDFTCRSDPKLPVFFYADSQVAPTGGGPGHFSVTGGSVAQPPSINTNTAHAALLFAVLHVDMVDLLVMVRARSSAKQGSPSAALQCTA